MPRYSASHGFYRYFGFEKRHHLLRPALHARVSLILTPLRSRARDRFAARESAKFAACFVRKRNGLKRGCPTLIIERFRGEKLHTRRAFRKYVSPTTEKVTVYIAHSKSRSVKFVSDIGGGNPRPSRSPRASSGLFPRLRADDPRSSVSRSLRFPCEGS